MALVWDANRARDAGLVQLPRSVQGAACSNCKFFRYEPQARDRSTGYCSHFRMMMNVMADWTCSMWARPDAPLAAPPGQQGGMGRRFARHLVRRYSRAARGPGLSGGTDGDGVGCSSASGGPGLSVDTAAPSTNGRSRDGRGSRAAAGLPGGAEECTGVTTGLQPVGTALSYQRDGGDIRVVPLSPDGDPMHVTDLAPVPDRSTLVRRFIRRFARAGDADDCGHKRKRGTFTDGNDCAVSGSAGESTKGPEHIDSPHMRRIRAAAEQWAKKFPDDVLKAARETDPDRHHGGGGNAKIWIYDLYNKYKDVNPYSTFDKFKEDLVKASRSSEVSLLRHDMPQTLSEEERQISELSTTRPEGMDVEFHFVSIPRERL